MAQNNKEICLENNMGRRNFNKIPTDFFQTNMELCPIEEAMGSPSKKTHKAFNMDGFKYNKITFEDLFGQTVMKSKVEIKGMGKTSREDAEKLVQRRLSYQNVLAAQKQPSVKKS